MSHALVRKIGREWLWGQAPDQPSSFLDLRRNSCDCDLELDLPRCDDVRRNRRSNGNARAPGTADGHAGDSQTRRAASSTDRWRPPQH